MSKLRIALSYVVDSLPGLETDAGITFMNERNGDFDYLSISPYAPPSEAPAAAPASAPAASRPKATSKTTTAAPTQSNAEAAADEAAKKLAEADALRKAVEDQAKDDVLGEDETPAPPVKTTADLINLLKVVVDSGPDGNAMVTTFVKEGLGFKSARAIPLEKVGEAYAKAQAKFAALLPANLRA